MNKYQRIYTKFIVQNGEEVILTFRGIESLNKFIEDSPSYILTDIRNKRFKNQELQNEVPTMCKDFSRNYFYNKKARNNTKMIS